MNNIAHNLYLEYHERTAKTEEEEKIKLHMKPYYTIFNSW